MPSLGKNRETSRQAWTLLPPSGNVCYLSRLLIPGLSSAEQYETEFGHGGDPCAPAFEDTRQGVGSGEEDTCHWEVCVAHITLPIYALSPSSIR